ncbi:hypothetical protein H5410_056717 [Solanum commersonii]|uniref:Uncharacterized protein n=1 Tax=Solanum commersonii TaxID=4109 RepID=A0A9J5WN16_SOLCO|nr:hypothetical protein H5410_056717 [Solanum commersonii]
MTYYDPYDNDEVRMAKRLGHIPECQFRELLNYWKNSRRKIRRKYHLRISLWLQEQENPGVCTRLPMKILLAEMEVIEKQMSVNNEYVNAFSSVMGPEHPDV